MARRNRSWKFDNKNKKLFTGTTLVKDGSVNRAAITSGTYGASSTIPVITINTAGEITAISNQATVDADTLGGLSSGSFIRSNASDNVAAHTEWQDNYEIRLGTGADFRMKFDGTNTVFRNYAHAGGDIVFQGEDSGGQNENLLLLDTSSTAGFVRLYQAGAERLRTISSGVAVADGTIAATSPGQLALSRSNDNPFISFHTNAGTRIGYIQQAGTDTNDPFYIQNETAGTLLTLKNDMLWSADFVPTGDIRGKSQIRAAGWWNSAASDENGLAFEIGTSSGEAYALSYNRTTSSYGAMNFNASSFYFDNTATFNSNIHVGQYIYHKDDTNTYIRMQGDDLQLVAGGRQMIRMDEGTDPDRLYFVSGSSWTDSADTWNLAGDVVVGGTLENANGSRFLDPYRDGRHIDSNILFAVTEDDTTETIQHKFGNTNITRVSDSTAPAQGCFEVDAATSPIFGDYIKVDDETEIIFEFYAKFHSGSDTDARIYAGGQFYDASKTSLGNVQRYWAQNGTALDSNSNTGWRYYRGVLRGRGSSTGQVHNSAEWMRLLFLFNYQGAGNVTRFCGLRVFKGRQSVSSIYRTGTGRTNNTSEAATNSLVMDTNGKLFPQSIRIGGTATKIEFDDNNSYVFATGGSYNWGLYWDTDTNQMKWRGGGNERGHIDLDNGNVNITGGLTVASTQQNNGATTLLNGGVNGGDSNITLNISKGANTKQALKITNEAGDAHTWFAYSNGSNYITADADNTDGKTYIRSETGGTYTTIATFAHGGTTTLAGTLTLGSQVINDVEDIYLRDRIYHDGDTDTYIQFHAANEFRVVTGGSERFEVNNSNITATRRFIPYSPGNFDQTSVTSLTSAPIYFPEVNVGSTDSFLPAYHMRGIHSGGYRTNMNVGLFKDASAWGNGVTGHYIALGGNDSYPTQYFTHAYGGEFKHSTANYRLGLQFLELGEAGTNAGSGARTVLIEGVANASNSEGSGRIFFTEHNSTDASKNKYGLSLNYYGDPSGTFPISGAAVSGTNATWALRRHDNSVNGANIMSGNRTDSNITFHGTAVWGGNVINDVEDIYLRDRIYHDADTDTYMQFDAADSWRVVVAGAQELKVTATETTVSNQLTLTPQTGAKAIHAVANYTNGNANEYAIYLDMNVSGSTAATADRTHAGLYIDLDSSYTGGDTSNEGRVYGAHVLATSSGDNDVVMGGYFLGQCSGTDAGVATQTTNLYGIQGYADNNRSTLVANQYGVFGYSVVDNAGATATVNTTNSYAVYGKHLSSTGGTGGTVTNAVGGYFEVECDEGAITTARGVQSHIDRDAGTISTGYLFYGSFAGTVGTKHGLYLSGDTYNSMSGSLTMLNGAVIGDSASRTSGPHNADGLQINSTNDEKIVLTGSTQPYIRFQESTTDKAFIRWLTNGQLHFNNQEGGTFSFESAATTTAVNIKFQASDADLYGSVYGTHSNEMGFLDQDGNWAIRVIRDDEVRIADNNITSLACGQGATGIGDYGSVVTGSSDGKGNYEGYSIGGRYLLMSDSQTNIGIYNDARNEWVLLGKDNAEVRLYHNGTEKFRTRSDGCQSNAFFYSSDERLKENIVTIDDSINKIKQLRGVEYDWKRSGKRDIGVIAQEVEQVIPEVVSKVEGKDEYVVEYGHMVGLLIEGIKEQQKEIDELKALVKELLEKK